MKQMAEIPENRPQDEQPLSQSNEPHEELIDTLSIALIGVVQTQAYFLELLSQSAARDALYNSASPEMVAHWLSALSEMATHLTWNMSDRPRIQTYISRGCLKTSRTECSLLVPRIEIQRMTQLSFFD